MRLTHLQARKISVSSVDLLENFFIEGLICESFYYALFNKLLNASSHYVINKKRKND